ncbi:MAG: EAL domain-containing protein [Erysipelotrichaceae bacterium]|nr:EAL domain-containing protein [Erysipelotrichaceae bacterium]
MFESHEKFHSSNGKRQILVVDDELINRELLSYALQENYEVFCAEDGKSALEMIREKKDVLSCVLLDLMMPVMSGQDLLKLIKSDPEIRHLPVIVMTADQNSEVECLNLGATDFIPKPYPNQGVILARLRRTIELSEDRQIIQVTERDSLTGLYNREYFYRYAEQYDQYHMDTPMDAVVIDVNHFHMINERYGRAYGDQVLKRIGEKVREIVREDGGIVCRRQADTFLVYCPHRNDYETILKNASAGLSGEDESNNRVRLRIGIYADADKTIDIERRFDRAKLAADTIRSSFTRTIAVYDNAMHEAELYNEQLIEDFPNALREHQFTVFYQPKFDIRNDIPVLSSAEALVRWIHPELGMISPGVFIPLFENNGLIEELDAYVWRMAASQIRVWKERFGISVPVSVNVSRIDMYNPDIVGSFKALMEEFCITPHEFLLEITESAYTEDSAQIIDKVNRLRAEGFRIEMDDFGTGYSSLNMISSLPIDALKLDMRFIREAFRNQKDTHMIEVIIDIADYLGVPVIAEGVETAEQLQALKDLGCDIVQGYYFSRPVPPEEYERYIRELKDAGIQHAVPDTKKIPEEEKVQVSLPVAWNYESIWYVDTETGRYVRFAPEGDFNDLQMAGRGDSFFKDARRLIMEEVCEADKEMLAVHMDSDTMKLQTDSGFWRLNFRRKNDSTVYRLSVITAGEKGERLILGVSRAEKADDMPQAEAELADQAAGSLEDLLHGNNAESDADPERNGYS